MSDEKIRVLVVDDIPETREQIKKLLMFEPDLEVVGAAGTGREAVEMAQESKPNIVLMDINMPDMDGIEATEKIATAVPTAAVVMMSVQSEADYLRRAMLAGASDFLTKPLSGDDLYATIRRVHERKLTIIATMPVAAPGGGVMARKPTLGAEQRLGKIVVVYSPQGGAGCTTIATNVAAGLMREGTKVLLVDADLQFGDVGAFLNITGVDQTLSSLCESVDDLDMELVENVLVSHDSGLRVLLGPKRPEFADAIQPQDVTNVIKQIAQTYDFVIVDTYSRLDEVTISLFEIASQIIVICTPTLPGVKNVRFVIELFDQITPAEDQPSLTEKTTLVVNRAVQARQRGRVTIPTELIQKHLKMEVFMEIPAEERVVLHAINRGVPVIAIDKDRKSSPAKELIELADRTFQLLTGEEEEEFEGIEEEQPGGISGLFRRN